MDVQTPPNRLLMSGLVPLCAVDDATAVTCFKHVLAAGPKPFQGRARRWGPRPSPFLESRSALAFLAITFSHVPGKQQNTLRRIKINDPIGNHWISWARVLAGSPEVVWGG